MPNSNFDAKAKAVGSHRKFNRLVRTYLKKWKREPLQASRINVLLGEKFIKKRIPASAGRARLILSELLIDALSKKFDSAGANRKFYSITVIPKWAETLDRNPEINRRLLARTIREAVLALRLHAVCMIELQGVTNFPGRGHGRMLMAHGQGFGWVDGIYDIEAEAARLNAMPEWPKTSLGADAIMLVPVTDREAVRYLGYYISKSPHDAKMAYGSGRAGGWRLQQVMGDYRGEFATRIFEILSHYDLRKLLIGVGGEGDKLVADAIQKLGKWHRKQLKRNSSTKNLDTEALWRELRLHNGSQRYKQVARLKGDAKPERTKLPPVERPRPKAKPPITPGSRKDVWRTPPAEWFKRQPIGWENKRRASQGRPLLDLAKTKINLNPRAYLRVKWVEISSRSRKSRRDTFK